MAEQSLDLTDFFFPYRPIEPRMHSRACAECGRQFAPKRAWQTHCRPDCRKDGWKARQHVLELDPAPAPLPPVQDQRPTRVECEKLKGDNALVLRRLRQGPATTAQLAEAAPRSLAIHSRVADVRAYLERQGETVTRRQIAPRCHWYWIEAL